MSVQRNTQSLATQPSKVKHELAPMIAANVFCATPEKHYNLRNCNDFRVHFERNVYHGTARISYPGSQIWDIGSTELKQVQSFISFKKSVRN